MRCFCIILIVIFCSCNQKNKPCEIAYVKEFATQYTYDEWSELTQELPENFCSKVINAYQCDSSETMVYLNLIMLKMYLAHLKLDERGYFVAPMHYLNELDEHNCMYYFLWESAKRVGDGVFSGIGCYNVENDSTLLKNKAIRTAFLEVKEYKRHLDSLATYHLEQLK